MGSRVFGDHVGVHLDLRDVGDPVKREGFPDSHLPTPDVRDVTRPIGHPLFVHNLEVIDGTTIREKVEEATGGRAVDTRPGPTRIIMGKDERPVDRDTQDGPFEHEPNLPVRVHDSRGKDPGGEERPIVPELDGGLVKG